MIRLGMANLKMKWNLKVINFIYYILNIQVSLNNASYTMHMREKERPERREKERQKKILQFCCFRFCLFFISSNTQSNMHYGYPWYYILVSMNNSVAMFLWTRDKKYQAIPTRVLLISVRDFISGTASKILCIPPYSHSS